MDIFFVFFVSFILLLAGVYKGIFIAYPLFFVFILFVILAYKKGIRTNTIFEFLKKGVKVSFVVFQVLLLIGGLTGSWMSSGTVGGLVYYGITYLNPTFFAMYAFLICSFVSFLLGSSFGTVGTIGIALMVITRSADGNIPLIAGAIIAGAYVGDRNSPMSSSALLVSTITNTDIFTNISNMFKSSLIPFLIASIGFAILSLSYPMNFKESSITYEILSTYTINWITLLPALIIILSVRFKIKVKKAIILSLLSAGVISILIQQNSPYEFIRHVVFGYSLEPQNPLATIISGGGMTSMIKIITVIIISSSIASIIEAIKITEIINKYTYKAKSERGVFLYTVIISFFSAAFGCSQVIAVMLTHLLGKDMYKKNEISNEILALNIENTAIVIAPLIPWNIAVLAPLLLLEASPLSIFYALYLYILPAYRLLVPYKGKIMP
ncbi:NhaC family Na+:H+ antiporter [Acetoanaerobium pronyense]|uniref:NhaC family Na+:H+ antiporter n=1 Tax=Acetoanaerobium pronyense TaxID=1482736 RepID=A0ABS4KEV2_9FIRM|nr:Na+/H+ antiporter NhaC family protein [Acetoanaerobium pronyense]MBP2026298.1 NhaC family Na+:H+ antiporter [Acetoanaerobium pronyense]